MRSRLSVLALLVLLAGLFAVMPDRPASCHPAHGGEALAGLQAASLDAAVAEVSVAAASFAAPSPHTGAHVLPECAGLGTCGLCGLADSEVPQSVRTETLPLQRVAIGHRAPLATELPPPTPPPRA